MSGERISGCTDPHHHVHDAEAYLRVVKKACLDRQLRLTPIREQVLQLLAEYGRPVKAYDLLEMMRSRVGANAPPTVYRALDFLIENAFIHKLASINAYVACHHPDVSHSVPFLICDNCQNAIELEDDSIAECLVAKAGVLGFQTRAQVLEVHGLCRDCFAGAAK